MDITLQDIILQVQVISQWGGGGEYKGELWYD